MSAYLHVRIAADRARSELGDPDASSIFSPTKRDCDGWPRVRITPFRRGRAESIEAVRSTQEADRAAPSPWVDG